MRPNTPSFDKLVQELSKFPGVGEKTAQRMAYYVLKVGDSYSSSIRTALREVEENIHPCPQCFNYTEEETVCTVCQDENRDNHSICVVEDPSDIGKVEYAGVFRGQYHVLQGAISPLEGVHPEDLKIQELIDRITKEDSEVEEVILALDADLEGDTTALYISRQLAGKVKITRIAHGVPFGTDIDYIDQRTLGRALENRVEL